MRKSPEDFDNIVDQICRIHTVNKTSSTDLARRYQAIIGFFSLVKKDQATLRSEKPVKDSDIPAISVVLHNKALFASLLKCLEVDLDPIERSEGRKRALSIDAGQSKIPKTSSTQSPVPQINTTIRLQNSDPEPAKPAFPLEVVAVAILYACFRHLDHWPAVFVKLYAEDCFGPRKWVDDPRCELFVKNIQLIMEKQESPIPQPSLTDAKTVFEAYSSFQYRENVVTTDSQRETSFGSVTSRRPRGASLDHSLNEAEMSRNDNGDSSDSGDELEESLPKSTLTNSCGDHDDSSSGEEDEMEVTTSSFDEGLSCNEVGATPSTDTQGSGATLYPLSLHSPNFDPIRQRYFAENLDFAHRLLTESLGSRLENRMKQNSSLLQTLPFHVSIPSVRKLVAENLGKWLQSPALAGLARKLFKQLITSLDNCDPPRPDDLAMIDEILSIEVKTNQIAFYSEHVAMAAKNVGSEFFLKHMYARILERGLLELQNGVNSPENSFLHVFGFIHSVVDDTMSYDALAASILSILSIPKSEYDGERSFGIGLVNKGLKHMFRAIDNFETDRLAHALMSFRVQNNIWSLAHEENRILLVLSCIFEYVSGAVSPNQPLVRSQAKSPHEENLVHKKRLMNLRRQILSWCCEDYIPLRIQSNPKKELQIGERSKFDSYVIPKKDLDDLPEWLSVCSSVLFLDIPSSQELHNFLSPLTCFDVVDETGKEEENYARCQELCIDLEGGMIRYILKQCSREGDFSNEMAIDLLEMLICGCREGSSGKLLVSDPTLIWEMYELVSFEPKNYPICTITEKEIPRLAFSVLWWRVTIIAVLFSASDPSKIASVMWDDHPTVRMFIKMIVSGNCRFPTVDCDEHMESEMKADEQKAHEIESDAIERCFLPEPMSKPEKNISQVIGSRVSMRILKKQMELEAVQEAAEKERRRKMLGAVLKTLMMWDPSAWARNPPEEVITCLQNLDSEYSLSVAFQSSTSPDYVLRTIGGDTRGAFERASEWLIPKISIMPDAIGRLPSSASCFLLLRAYGREIVDMADLKLLARPLLIHVKECLQGKYGTIAFKNAVDVLLTDLSSSSTERRRCSRRVLQDTLTSQSEELSGGTSSWALEMLKLPLIEEVLESCISNMSRAASFERGQVLRELLLSLSEYFDFARSAGIPLHTEFSTLLIGFISSRQDVYSHDLKKFKDLLSLAVKTVSSEFLKAVGGHTFPSDVNNFVEFNIRSGPSSEPKVIRIPFALLQGVIVVLSVWHPSADTDSRKDGMCTVFDALLCGSSDPNIQVGVPENQTTGLSTGIFPETNSEAISVAMWIRLVKSQSDVVTFRAAQSAPCKFLPRLILSSGLAQTALSAIIDRLGTLGDTNPNPDALFQSLLTVSMADKFDLGRVGPDKALLIRLLERIEAYKRLHRINTEVKGSFSWTFYEWLKTTCAESKKDSADDSHWQDAKSLLDTVGELSGEGAVTEKNAVSFQHAFTEFREYGSHLSKGTKLLAAFALEESFDRKSPTRIEMLLEACRYPDFLLHLSIPQIESLCERLKDSFCRGETWAHGLIEKWYPPLASKISDVRMIEWLLTNDHDVDFKERIFCACLRFMDRESLSKLRSLLLSKIWGKEEFRIALGQQIISHSDEMYLKEEYEKIMLSVVRTERAQSRASTVAEAVRSLLKCDQFNPNFICSALVAEKSDYCDVFEEILLQNYLSSHHNFDFSENDVQEILLRSAARFKHVWVGFNCSIDSTLDNILVGIASRGMRPGSYFSELAVSHPLLLFRKSSSIFKLLSDDASPMVRKEEDSDSAKDRIVGSFSGSPLKALVNRNEIHLSVYLWGLSYYEPLWLSILDLFVAVPHALLFGAGIGLGFDHILALYIQLLSVQAPLFPGVGTARLKDRIARVLSEFKSQNSDGWKRWSCSTFDGNAVQEDLEKAGLQVE